MSSELIWRKRRERANKHANEHYGECLDVFEGSNGKARATWKCNNGHVWITNLNDTIRCKSWCKNCATSKTENTIRMIFEALFEKPFVKIRPEWLKSSTGGYLEIDGYCEELKLGFEYQGAFHYEGKSATSLNVDVETQKRRDAEKRQLTAQHGVKIIEIPMYKGKNGRERASINEIIYDIKNILLFNGYDFIDKEINVSENEYFNTKWDDIIRPMIEERGGVMLGHAYMKSSLVKARCANGHDIEVSIPNMNEGRWCKHCSGKTQESREEKVRKELAEHGWELLSEKYVRNSDVLSFKCPVGHVQERKYQSIKNTKYKCLICEEIENPKKSKEIKVRRNHIPFTIKNINEWVKTMDLECLETEYIARHKSMHWRCLGCGAEFTNSLAHIRYEHQRSSKCICQKWQHTETCFRKVDF